MENKFLEDLEKVQRQGAKIEFSYFDAITGYITEENKHYLGKFICVITLYMITRHITFRGYGDDNIHAFYMACEGFWKEIESQ